MVSVSAALDGLDVDAQARVLRWAAQKYNIASGTTMRAGDHLVDEGDDSNAGGTSQFNAFVDLYDAVSPDTSVEKVLVGSYWLQVVQGGSSWSSLQVNNLLKDTGNGVESIHHRLETAQSQKPALVRQISKTGKSRQGRKTYKLTTAGINLVAAKMGAKPTGAKVAEEV
jgi:hypothetical protein